MPAYSGCQGKEVVRRLYVMGLYSGVGERVLHLSELTDGSVKDGKPGCSQYFDVVAWVTGWLSGL